MQIKQDWPHWGAPKIRERLITQCPQIRPPSAGGKITEAACWAHARRKFYDIHVANKSPIAREALERIQVLYAIERRIRGKTPAERRAVRQVEAVPFLEAFQR